MFPGFTDADFDAYAAKKWKSNVFNRERLEVKQKLLALGRELSAGIAAADGSPLTLEASVEHPAQWNHKQVEAQHIFFSRSEAARKHLDGIMAKGQSLASLLDDPTPQRNHLFLAVTVAHDRIEVALKLHPDARVDRQNLERRTEDHFEREKLSVLLSRLAPGFQVGLSTEPLLAADAITEAQLTELVARLGEPAPMALPGGPQRLFYIGRAFPRAAVIALGAGFLDAARSAIVSLLSIYHFVAWSRENDFLSIRETLQKEKQSKRQRGLAQRDEVRIVRGMFAGTLGIVQEVDARGGLKVLVGKLAVKVAADDVEKR
ncbi:MAG: hypothetical protein EXR72_17430 [Myxococcales bacterium]|nr:hypothetical protein [Myxococcales bacterium]